MKTWVKVLPLAGLLLVIAVPSYAQLVGAALGTPTAFLTTIAQGVMVAGAAAMTIGGGYKAVQVWSGSRNLFDASTYLIGGGALLFGTGALMGF